MTAGTREALEDRAALLFRALAHPARVAAVVALSQATRTVGELALELGLGSSAMSAHLAVLRRAGLVQTTRVGTTNVNGLSVPAVAELLRAANAIVASSLARAAAVLGTMESESLRSRGAIAR